MPVLRPIVSRALRAPPLRLRSCIGCILALAASGCVSRDAVAVDPGQLPPGTISVPFRNRWWHFYERGLSWAEHGRDQEAESDFRQCLRLRATDSRVARTYGMHFVQSFAHRELGAVLLRTGRLDEAERELLTSARQEPSAKTDVLLERLRAQRGGMAPRAATPGSDARQRSGTIELTSISAAGGGQGLVQVTGIASGMRTLWQVDATGAPTRLPTSPDGAFSTTVAAGTQFALGTMDGPDKASAPVPAVSPPAQAPSLELSGPATDAIVSDDHVWIRWSAVSAAGIERLSVRDGDGPVLHDAELHGLRSAGTVRLVLSPGDHDLRFELRDRAGATALAVARIHAQPLPQQDRSLRAVALAIPLQPAHPGSIRPGDDPRLVSALIENGRFRFIDRRADEILARELSLVEAGYVDAVTAAEAGRRLATRYVLAGTMNRGERDIECFVRLIHCDSGRVVASADAYAELASSGDADAFFDAVAGRLRQVFPVVSGTVVADQQGSVRLDCGGSAGVVAHMRLHICAQPPVTGQRIVPVGSGEITEVHPDHARVSIDHGAAPARGWGVSE